MNLSFLFLIDLLLRTVDVIIKRLAFDVGLDTQEII